MTDKTQSCLYAFYLFLISSKFPAKQFSINIYNSIYRLVSTKRKCTTSQQHTSLITKIQVYIIFV